MPEDDHVGVGEACAERLQTALGGTGVVDHRDANACELDLALLREPRLQRRLIDVARDREHRWAEARELIQHGNGAEIARVQDQLGRCESLPALRRQDATASRQMSIGDDGYQHASQGSAQ